MPNTASGKPTHHLIAVLSTCILLAASAPRAALSQAAYLAAVSSSSLPDAPVPVRLQEEDKTRNPLKSVPSAAVVAGPFDKTIDADQVAPRITPGDKILMGLRTSVTTFAAVGWLFGAGYEQALDGSPNYGHQTQAFLQRFGAGAARATSENIFTTSVLAPILHEDPRYYVKGPGHNPLVRAGYAITRPFITRTDGGQSSINFAQIGGNVAGSALTDTYYPSINRGFSETAKTFAGSMEGAAIGDFIREFVSGTALMTRLKHID